MTLRFIAFKAGEGSIVSTGVEGHARTGINQPSISISECSLIARSYSEPLNFLLVFLYVIHTFPFARLPARHVANWCVQNGVALASASICLDQVSSGVYKTEAL
jgi:hypothetical protein